MSDTTASGDEQQKRQQEHDQKEVGVTKLQVLVAIATNSTSSNKHEQDKTNINHDANANINACDNSSMNAEASANANGFANSSCIPSQMPIDVVTRLKEPQLQLHNDVTATYNAIPIANANDSSANDAITPTATPTATKVHKSPPSAPHPQSITLDDSRLDMNEMAFSLGPKFQIQKEEQDQDQEYNSQQELQQKQRHARLPNHAHVLPLTFRNMANNLNHQSYNSNSQCHSRTHENHTREPQLQSKSTHSSSDAITQESTFVPTSTTATTTTSNANILSLPLDALHSIATFTTVDEWRNFGITNREASLACRDVFQTAKMHAFNCAIEVVTTWNRGEHADAKELAALYVICGVPIYPTPLGHAYHTLHWRMKVQSDDMKASDDIDETGDSDDDRDTGASNPSSKRKGQLDRFYLERHEARNVVGYYLPSLTYLEEKGLFWRSKNNGISTQLTREQRQNSIQRFNIRPPPPPLADGIGFLGFYDDDDDEMPNIVEQRRVIGIGENVALGPGDAQFGHIAEISAMRETYANFSPFHRQPSRREEIASVNASQPKRCTKEPKIVIHCHKHLVDRHLQGKPAICDDLGIMDAPPISLSADFFHPVLSRPYPNHDERSAAIYERSVHGHVSAYSRRPPSRRSSRNASASAEDVVSVPIVHNFVEHSVIAELELHCYDSESGDDYAISLRKASFKKLKLTEFVPALTSNQVTEIIKRFQRQLSLLLKRGDYHGFDECLFDFWDEFFPLTKNVHYYDRHTPVPRMSKMHTFLTKPCPKAFGTMQCEIERVRVKYRVKGMITGRYYHTHEYRLFIRDRRKPNYDGTIVEEFYPQMDTVLMTAKYRGKHYSGPSGLSPVLNGKKGVNNFFLYMPKQSDIDEHYDFVNKDVEMADINIYKQDVPAAGSNLELCRLQTNHLGTEFQITSPRPIRRENSSDGLDRKQVESEPAPLSEVQSQSPLSDRKNNPALHPKKLKTKRKDKIISKKSFARITPFSFKKNGANLPPKSLLDTSTEEEKEIGAITYTANVLGNRPRIMNVSIPTICDQTEMPCATDDTWTKGPGQEGTMLSHLKTLQQRRNDNTTADENEDPSLQDDFGLMSLQNRPPWWNVDLAAFVLNFGGRVSVASVKNFQLCDREDHENIMLQFGRIDGRHSFTMDFSYPLSPVQAFAISISSLQSKISFA